MQRRYVAMLVGALAGVLLAGVLVGLAIPNVPAAWRSPVLLWLATAALVAAGVGVALRVAGRPKT